MSGYTDVFGGGTLQAAQVAYRSVALTANMTLVWPPYSVTGTNYVARIMNVTPSGAGLSITMPDATLVSPGQDVFFNNLGGSSFTVYNNAGGVICTVAAGQVKYLYLNDNSTAAGGWSVVTLGIAASSPDAGALAGYGLRALTNTLNLASTVTTFSANTSVASTDRSKVFVWIGGSGTLTLPALVSASSLPDWEIEVRNQGTGTLTIATTGGEQIDGGSNVVLQVTESCFVHSGPTAWYTVGRGRNTQFNFTKLAKSVTGGTTTLSLTEASNVIQVYTGVLTSNETIVVPSAVQVYYITNSTSGAFTFTVKSPITGGSTVTISQNASAIIYCDGTNVINCNTSGVTVNAVALAGGSAASPSLSFAADPSTGVYQPTTGQLAITISGTQAVLVTSTGINNTAIGATTPSTGSFTTLAASGAVSGAGFVALQASPNPIGSTAPNTGAFTTLSTTGAITAGGAINKVTITSPATGSTLTIADGKTLTASNTLTFAGTDGSSVAFGTGGTVTYTSNNLSVFAATTSAQLAGVISDETGTGALVFANTPTLVSPVLGTPTSGTLTNCTGLPVSTGVSGLGTGVATFLATPSSANLASALTDKTGTGANVFATSPTLTTPTLGVAAATSINKVAITAPATGSTLTIADGKTLTASNTLTLSGTDGSSVAFGAGGTVVYAGAATGSGLTMSTGKILGRSTAGSGAIEEISVGTGLSLTGGTLTATVATSGLVLLQTQTVSGVATCDFTSGIDATYQEYELHCINVVPASAGAQLQLLTSANAGVSWDSGAGNYDWLAFGYENNGGSASFRARASSSDTKIQLEGSLSTGASNAVADGGYSGVLRVIDPAGTSSYKQVLGELTYVENLGGGVALKAIGRRLATAAVNGLRVKMSGGNLSGTLKLYGVQKS